MADPVAAQDAATKAWVIAQIPNDIDIAKFSGAIGDGVATTFAVSHGLNTTNVQVKVKETSTGDFVITKTTVTNASVVTVSFSQPPTANQYTVEVMG